MSLYGCNDCHDTGEIADDSRGGGDVGDYCWCGVGVGLRHSDKAGRDRQIAGEAEARAYVDRVQSQQLLIKGKYEHEYFDSIADMRDRYLGDD